MIRFRSIAALGFVLLAGCPSDHLHMGGARDERSLYARLGGEKAITAVTEDFLDRAAHDKRVDLERKGSAHPWQATPANLAILKVRAVALMCKVTGGPDYYAAVGGRDMKTSHAGMGISEAEWQVLVEDFTATLNGAHVPAREKQELLTLVGSLHDDIVEKKGATRKY